MFYCENIYASTEKWGSKILDQTNLLERINKNVKIREQIYYK